MVFVIRSDQITYWDLRLHIPLCNLLNLFIAQYIYVWSCAINKLNKGTGTRQLNAKTP